MLEEPSPRRDTPWLVFDPLHGERVGVVAHVEQDLGREVWAAAAVPLSARDEGRDFAARRRE